MENLKSTEGLEIVGRDRRVVGLMATIMSGKKVTNCSNQTPGGQLYCR
jgi:hypothetical protein